MAFVSPLFASLRFFWLIGQTQLAGAEGAWRQAALKEEALKEALTEEVAKLAKELKERTSQSEYATSVLQDDLAQLAQELDHHTSALMAQVR